jgi:two-component system chemotaxis response regulator CheB
LEALDLIIKSPKGYDAILLDINMPKMNGLEFLEQLNKNRVKVRTIVVSTLALEGAEETIRALELGAFDFVTKPGSFLDAKGESFKNKLLKCLSLALGLSDGTASTGSEKKEVPKRPLRSSGKVIRGSKLVALACSTGGPKALQQVIPSLPGNLDAPMLLVQHMPEGFTKPLADRLNSLSNIRVKEAEDGDLLEKGVVYIAKGGRQMRLLATDKGGHRIELTEEPARGGLRPCADIMYESLVDSDFEKITCVVLTGMGADGTEGIKQLKDTKKIYVIAQDKESSTVYGMPKVVAEAGLVNEVVPLDMVSNAITTNVGVR